MTDTTTITTTVRRAPTSGHTPHAPSRRVRLAWLIPGGILAVAALVWGAFNVIGLLAHEEYSSTITYTASDMTALDVRSDNGSVTVNSTDADEVVVTADVSDGWRAADVSTRIVDGVLVLRGQCSFMGAPWCNVDFTVSIPADRPVTIDAAHGSVRVNGTSAAVDVDTDNGSIYLEDIGGDIRASNDNGRITGRRLVAGSVDARTDNGRIELSFLEPPTSVTARTNNGRIDVVVPDDDADYSVSMHSDHGSSDNSVRTDPSSDRVIDLSNDTGSITLRPPG